MSTIEKIYRYYRNCFICKKRFKTNYPQQKTCNKVCSKKLTHNKPDKIKSDMLNFTIEYITKHKFFKTSEITMEYIKKRNIRIKDTVHRGLRFSREYKDIVYHIKGFITFLVIEKVIEKFSNTTYISNKKAIEKLKELKDKSINRTFYYFKMNNLEKTYNSINKGLDHIFFLDEFNYNKNKFKGKKDSYFNKLYNSFFLINKTPITKTLAETRYIKFSDNSIFYLESYS